MIQYICNLFISLNYVHLLGHVCGIFGWSFSAEEFPVNGCNLPKMGPSNLIWSICPFEVGRTNFLPCSVNLIAENGSVQPHLVKFAHLRWTHFRPCSVNSIAENGVGLTHFGQSIPIWGQVQGIFLGFPCLALLDGICIPR